jgi:rhodanese-related sulfurtransferase
MGLIQSIKQLFGGKASPAPARRTSTPYEPEPEPDVPEVTAKELLAEMAEGGKPLLIDCLESWERRMAHIPADLHIPMNDTPRRLAEIESAAGDKERPVVVYCASGNRSYGVAHFLKENGFQARSLSGGIARWQMAKGPVERG